MSGELEQAANKGKRKKKKAESPGVPRNKSLIILKRYHLHPRTVGGLKGMQ